jgi:hypothetical protein
MARLRTVFVGTILGGAVSAVLTPRLLGLHYRRLVAARRGRTISAFVGPPCTQDSRRAGETRTEGH